MVLLRSGLFILAIALNTIILGSLIILSSFFSPSGNLPNSIARFWARLILLTSRVRVEVQGQDNIPSGQPVVFMSNHVSYFDVPALMVYLPGQIRFLARRELIKVPIFGWALYLARHIIVDHAHPRKTLRNIGRALKNLKEGTNILVFPEGARSFDGRLQTFKKGGISLAIKSGVPIIPISIKGSGDILPRGSGRIRPGRIKIALGKPIGTRNYTRKNSEELVKRLREAISTNLDRLS
ncbi:MAG: 1-acyl-sn-glycerol-3-phosphate acyltransferase [Deltaproteobacteria bacterium]|nr:MAG: 1-acyl-sn-glycerol-3-phosphate acyltransferase [Deltaproteobacteria bacterium]